MANILFNIRRMKQEIGRAPDQRPVPVEILLHDQVMSCWRTSSASIIANVMPVEMVVSFSPDGAIEVLPLFFFVFRFFPLLNSILYFSFLFLSSSFFYFFSFFF